MIRRTCIYLYLLYLDVPTLTLPEWSDSGIRITTCITNAPIHDPGVANLPSAERALSILTADVRRTTRDDGRKLIAER